MNGKTGSRDNSSHDESKPESIRLTRASLTEAEELMEAESTETELTAWLPARQRGRTRRPRRVLQRA